MSKLYTIDDLKNELGLTFAAVLTRMNVLGITELTYGRRLCTEDQADRVRNYPENRGRPPKVKK